MLVLTISKLFLGKAFEISIILSAILLPIKLTVVYAVFGIALLELVLSAPVADCLG